MRKLMLSALLLASSTALAGGAQGPVWAPALTGAGGGSSTVVIPALPPGVQAGAVSAAPQVAPAPAAPMTSTSAPVPSASIQSPAAQARTLLLTAPSGTSVTLRQTARVQAELEDVQATGAAAKMMSEKDIAALKQQLAEDAQSAAEPTELVMTVGEVYPDGSRDLISSLMIPAPTGDGTEASEVRIIQRVSAGGQVTGTRVESDSAEVQGLFAGLSDKELSGLVTTDTGVYGIPLVPGQKKVTTETVETQGLIAGMVGGALQAAAEGEGAAELRSLAQSIQASPLTVTTATTYRGTDAQGRHVFDVQGSAQPWTVKVDGSGAPEKQDVPFRMTVTISDLSVNGSMTYRPDGLPSRLDLKQDMRMMMTITTGGKDAGTFTMALRLKTDTLSEEVVE